MLSKLLNLLFGRRDGTTFLDGSLLLDRHGEPFRQTAATATLTLLLEAARADHQVSSDELLEICRLLDQQFALRGEKARDLMATALEQQEEPQKAAQFLNILARRFDLEQRQLILCMAWRVVLADRRVHANEARLMEFAQQELRLSKEEAEVARQGADELARILR